MKPSKQPNKGKIRNVVGKIFSLLLTVLLMIASLYIAQGNSVLDAISNANLQTTRFSVIVMKESNYDELSDLDNKTVEVNKDDSDNLTNTEKIIPILEKENSSIKFNNVDSYIKMADDLYSNDTDAILINEANYSMLAEEHTDFINDTKVIWSYDIISEVGDISKNVDVDNQLFTIYISGIDTTGPVSTVSRSDVNMLVTVNPKTKQILMTSIPRDYYVTLANKGSKDKLTHAGLGGVENSVKTIENFMDIDINYYARVNFTSLIEMVDALGGIDVYSDKTFTPYTNSSITIYQGMNHMDGETALAFARERYTYAEGDNHRVQNQQEVLKAMLEKAMSPSIITNYTSVLNSIKGSFETNMSTSEITDLIKMQLNDMSSWDIQQIQLSGSGKLMTGGAYMPNNTLYYMIPDENSITECSSIIKQMTQGEIIKID